jgi:fatty-acyl-CoA synthase
VALIHGDASWTFGQLHREVLSLARGLRGLGVRPGDRVAYLGPNHPVFLTTLFAAGMLGAVIVPVNFRLTEPEIRYQLTDSGASVLVHDAPGAAAAAAVAGIRHCIAVQAGPGEAAEGTVSYADLPAGEGHLPDICVQAGDPCLIMYTSGTTGKPKGAVLSHGNVIWNCLNVLVDTDLTADEVTLVATPLFHAAGLNMTCLPTLLKGGRVVLTSSFDPGTVLEMIEARRVTCMFGVPTMFDAMAAHPRWRTADLSSLRLLNCGGAPVPEDTMRAYQERGLPIAQGYGMTESGPGILFCSQGLAADIPGSAGVPHFFTDIRVARPDGSPAGSGERGEILVTGPNVMSGYWNKDADTAAAFTPDGWLRTGDAAWIDTYGTVHVVDRIKDMYVSGGENVYPAEVEEALRTHPAIGEAAIIGVPDSIWGEVGHAVVVLRPRGDADAADVLSFLRGKLAAYKLPRSVIFARELPRTGSGKVSKSALRTAYAARNTPTEPLHE